MKTNEPAGAELSMPELLHRLTDQTTTLFRQELDLVRAEISKRSVFAGESAGLFGAAALFGVGAFAALTVLLIVALSYVVELWAAALIVMVVYGIVAAVAVSVGQKKLKEMTKPPTKTMQSVREDVQAVRQGVERGR